MGARIATRLGLAAAMLAAVLGCGSSRDGGTGTMNVRIVDAPADYEEIWLDVRQVEIHSQETGWIKLPTEPAVVDVLTLVNGVSKALVTGAGIPEGRYGQMRLVLGPQNSILLKGETALRNLKVPSGMQSGFKLRVSFDVAPNTTKDVFIDLDAHRSVFVHAAGNSEQYILRPVASAIDKVVTGAITGTLTTGGAGLVGAEVTAQVVDPSGNGRVVRSVVTGAGGAYTLDLLPVPGTYYIVSQPVVGGVSYGAKVSQAMEITPAVPVKAAPSMSFDVAAQVGSIAGTITPTAGSETDHDVVDARQVLVTGTPDLSLVVRTAVPSVAGGVETYSMPALPVGSYSLLATRRTLPATPDGDETVTTSGPKSATVTSAATPTDVPFSFGP